MPVRASRLEPDDGAIVVARDLLGEFRSKEAELPPGRSRGRLPLRAASGVPWSRSLVVPLPCA